MNTLKTGVVVALLLAVLYGVYIVLNKPDVDASVDAAWPQPKIEWGTPPDKPGGTTPPTTSADLPPIPPSTLSASPPPLTSNAPAASPAPPLGSPPLTNPTPSPTATAAAPTNPTATGDDSPPLDSAVSVYQPRREGGVQPASGTIPEGPVESPNGSRYGVDTAAAPETRAAETTEPTAEPVGPSAFVRALRLAQAEVADKKFYEALARLSPFYGHPDLSATEQRELQDWLNPLAGEVIYSPRHYLAEPYQVRLGETLNDIAARYRVSPELLQKINGIRDPRVVVGPTIKVIPGPFRAEVDVAKGVLTVFVDRLYAGQFPVSFGNEFVATPGNYDVRERVANRPYYPRGGGAISASDPTNPYGRHWLDLGNGQCIHGSPELPSRGPTPGCISLSRIDAEDVFGILSVGSKVAVRR